MLTDHLTNTVFLSDWLSKECPILYLSLTKTLQDNAVNYRILANTNDIWCRDFMPIQTDEKRFVFYQYNPDYLQDKHKRRYITNVNHVQNIDFLRQAETANLDLVLDGGNVVKCGNKVVMTEKVFVENKEMSHNEVQRLLEEKFQCEIVFLPWDRNEKCGHSDGIVHYIGDNRVLLTNYGDFDKTFAQDFLRILEKHFDVKTLKYNVEKADKNSWAYINYLQVGNLVLVPQLGIPEDEQALQQIAEAMPQCKVVGVPALEAVRKGGALNCISWNIKSKPKRQ
ncbi:MAG: agmatine deiminase family protein [Bacteroidales bacterium]|nr:agmatine deiminase family protein [Bacteroidales bacterium]